MSDEEKQRPSSLDEEMLKALEAAEAGLPSPLLDDGFLVDTDFLEDNSPLVRPDGEAPIAAQTPLARPVPPLPRPRPETPSRRTTQTPSTPPTSGPLEELASVPAETTPDDTDYVSGTDDTLTEEELAALVAQRKSEKSDFDPELPLSQEDLDALINGIGHEGDEHGEDQETSTATPEEVEAPDSAPLIPHDDLGTESGAETEPSDTPAEETPMAQDELDALLAGTGAAEATDTPDTAPEEAPMAEADLDALLAGTGAAEATDTPDTEANEAPMAEADLDALLAGTGAAEATDTEAEEAPMAEADLDALLAGTGAAEATDTPDTEAEEAPMSEADLDALLAGTGAAEATDTPDTEAEEAPMSEADLDALLAGTGAAEATDTPDTPGKEAPDLDALLADAGAAAESDTSEGGSGAMSQEDLDALLATAAEESEDGASQSGDDDISGHTDEGTPTSATADGEAALDETNLDAVLGGPREEQVLDGSQLDAPVIPEEDSPEVSLSQSSIDSLMADLDSSGALDGLPASPEAESPPDDEAEEEEIGDISQDMIDSLIASAQQEATDERSAASKSEIGSENLAAAAASESGSESLSQSDLDKLIEASKNGDTGPAPASPAPLQEGDGASSADTALSPEAGSARGTGRGKRFRKQSPLVPFVQENAVRLAACLTMGTLIALGTGGILTLNREHRPDAGMERALDSLEIALTRARDKMASGDYVGVVEELDEPIAAAYPGQLRSDALFVRLEAQFRAFRGEWGTPEFDQMTANIDDVLKEVPSHPRIPEALYWKAKLFTADQPILALDIYKNIFEQYADAPERDRMLIEASQLALEQEDPLTAAIYAQNLLSNYPASPWAGEAKLAIGDANVKAGNYSDARTMFIRVAQSSPDSALAAKAFVRLGRLAYESGQYKNAEMHLKNQIETSTHLEGNDEVYLLLAQTYRASGQLENARDTLTDLLTFFEDSPLRPQAFIENAQVLEALGERERAIKTAQRATLEYPNNPDVLKNNGELQGLDGNPLAAAIAFVAADKAGAADPSLLLNAARYYRTANMPTEATRTYQRLKTLYAGSPEALSGSIEAARLRYEQGGTEGALDDLTSLLAATRGTRHQLPTLEAIQSIYRDLGLPDHIRTTARDIVSVATEPETLAQAAIDLIDNGDLENAQAAIGKLDLNRLRTRTAFSLLMKEGEALLSIAPQRGLEKMEQAYFNYPEARTRPSDQKLLRTYLDTGRAAAARRMVMDLKAHVETAPIDTPYLVDAAIAWGDFLYDKEDYRTAVFAFSIAEDSTSNSKLPVTGLRSDPEWARYQRANALLQLADYEGCLSLYESIAASDSPWAQEAAVKANLARLEQRQRGVPVAQNNPAG